MEIFEICHKSPAYSLQVKTPSTILILAAERFHHERTEKVDRARFLELDAGN